MGSSSYHYFCCVFLLIVLLKETSGYFRLKAHFPRQQLSATHRTAKKSECKFCTYETKYFDQKVSYYDTSRMIDNSLVNDVQIISFYIMYFKLLSEFMVIDMFLHVNIMLLDCGGKMTSVRHVKVANTCRMCPYTTEL